MTNAARATFLCISLLVCGSAEAAPGVTPAPIATGAHALPVTAEGRTVRSASGIVRQWPGTYFESIFSGRTAYFALGPGDVIVHVLVDDTHVETFVKPRPGMYRLDGLASGRHRLRIEVASESQSGPTEFSGFFAERGSKAVKRRGRQIEFIGDSFTVGYGNQSPTRNCTEDRVWETTDTSAAFGPLLARRYGADYQINAISGRGVVRSYNGANVDTLPTSYPFVLFDKNQVYRDASWRPRLIVIGLGTNDFSTELHAGEKWRSRDELRADFEATYTGFVRQLRSANPQAFLLLWATDTAGGEVAAETKRVVERLQAEGEHRVAFVEVPNLQFSGCNSHPSLADDRTIADRLAEVIEAQALFGR